jgi:hypothetical protein
MTATITAKLSAALLAAALAVGATAAGAQQAPAAPAAAPAQQEFSKDHLAAAKAAIDASQMFASLDQLLLSVTLQTKATLTKSSPSLGAQIDEVTNKVAIELAAKRPELDHQLQAAWASHFSKAELDELAKFLNSPVGKKWTKELPGVINGSGQAIQAWQKKIADEMMAKSRDELIKRGAKL